MLVKTVFLKKIGKNCILKKKWLKLYFFKKNQPNFYLWIQPFLTQTIPFLL